MAHKFDVWLDGALGREFSFLERKEGTWKNEIAGHFGSVSRAYEQMKLLYGRVRRIEREFTDRE